MFLQGNPIGDMLNNTEWAFPLAECIHIIGFGIAIGTVVLVDVRMLGWALTKETAAYWFKKTWLWHTAALLVVIFAGLALFFSDPGMYGRNPGFSFKMMALGTAILYNYTIHWKAAASGSSAIWVKLVAIISVLLWTTVVFGGIFIAFV
jgi:hypothetical protein